MLPKSFYPLWATISSFTKWGGESGSKILPRDKRKLQKNRHKLVKMQRINGMHVVECCVPEGSSAEASSQVQKSNMDVCVSAGAGGTEERGYSDKRKNGHKLLSSGLMCNSGTQESISLLLDLSKPYDFLCSMGH